MTSSHPTSNRSRHRPTAWGPRLLRTLLLASLLVGWVCDAPAAPPAVESARELLREGKAEEAYALLEPLEVQEAGKPEYDLLLGRAALASGRPSKASFVFERVLRVRPDLAEARVEMGRAYYQLGNIARARLEFEMVLQLQNLPADLRVATKTYVDTIEQLGKPGKAVFRGYAQAGYGHDSNVNSTAGGEVFTGAGGAPIVLGPAGLRLSDDYASVLAGAEVNYQVSPRVGLFGTLDYQGVFYDRLNVADYSILTGRVGSSYAGGRYQLSGAMTLGRYWLDDRSARDNYGINLDWRYSLANRNQLTAGIAFVRYDFAARLAVNEFDSSAITLGWTTALAPRATLSVTSAIGRERARSGRADGDRDLLGIRCALQAGLADKLGVNLNAGIQRGDFARVNPDFGTERTDTLYDATLQFSYLLGEKWSLQPQVVWIRNDSNLAITDFDRTDVSIHLRRDFW
jgi:tetratricopeptide (TPR) repeat protein